MNRTVKPTESHGGASPLGVGERERLLHLQLHAHVQDLSFPAYCQLIRHLLLQSGYATVRSLGHGQTRKCTGQGGLDLLAFSHTDLSTSLSAVQIKQLRQPVPRRFVDELIGVMLRARCDQAIIFATSMFSAQAKDAASEKAPLPIRLVDGQALTRMLFERQIGLRPSTGKTGETGEGERWEFDPLFFETLEQRAGRDRHTRETRAGKPLPKPGKDTRQKRGRPRTRLIAKKARARRDARGTCISLPKCDALSCEAKR